MHISNGFFVAHISATDFPLLIVNNSSISNGLSVADILATENPLLTILFLLNLFIYFYPNDF
jgi:hypothetical protein